MTIDPWEKYKECEHVCWRKDHASFWYYQRKEWVATLHQWIALFGCVFCLGVAVVASLWLAKFVGVY